MTRKPPLSSSPPRITTLHSGSPHRKRKEQGVHDHRSREENNNHDHRRRGKHDVHDHRKRGKHDVREHRKRGKHVVHDHRTRPLQLTPDIGRKHCLVHEEGLPRRPDQPSNNRPHHPAPVVSNQTIQSNERPKRSGDLKENHHHKRLHKGHINFTEEQLKIKERSSNSVPESVLANRLWLFSIILLFICFVSLLGVALAHYTGLIGSKSETDSSTEVSSSLKMMSEEFRPELQDPESIDFKAEEKKACAVTQSLMARGSYGDDRNECSARRFSEGSVVAHLKIRHPGEINVSQLDEELKTTLESEGAVVRLANNQSVVVGAISAYNPAQSTNISSLRAAGEVSITALEFEPLLDVIAVQLVSDVLRHQGLTVYDVTPSHLMTKSTTDLTKSFELDVELLTEVKTKTKACQEINWLLEQYLPHMAPSYFPGASAGDVQLSAPLTCFDVPEDTVRETTDGASFLCSKLETLGYAVQCQESTIGHPAVNPTTSSTTSITTSSTTSSTTLSTTISPDTCATHEARTTLVADPSSGPYSPNSDVAFSCPNWQPSYTVCDPDQSCKTFDFSGYQPKTITCIGSHDPNGNQQTSHTWVPSPCVIGCPTLQNVTFTRSETTVFETCSSPTSSLKSCECFPKERCWSLEANETSCWGRKIEGLPVVLILTCHEGCPNNDIYEQMQLPVVTTIPSGTCPAGSEMIFCHGSMLPPTTLTADEANNVLTRLMDTTDIFLAFVNQGTAECKASRLCDKELQGWTCELNYVCFEHDAAGAIGTN